MVTASNAVTRGVQGDGLFPWDRQRAPDGTLEPMLWFARFEAYRLAGPDRTLLGTVRAHKGASGRGLRSVPGAWQRAYKRWRWAKRAAAWDEHVLAEQRAAERRERQEWAARRRQLLQGYFGKIASILSSLPTPTRRELDDGSVVVENVPSLSALNAAIKTVLDEVRAEYDDLPQERAVIEHKGVAVPWLTQVEVHLTPRPPEEGGPDEDEGGGDG